MGERYSANDRYRGGSFEERLAPKLVQRELGTKIGLRNPKGNERESGNARRRSLIGLPPRFDSKG